MKPKPEREARQISFAEAMEILGGRSNRQIWDYTHGAGFEAVGNDPQDYGLAFWLHIYVVKLDAPRFDLSTTEEMYAYKRAHVERLECRGYIRPGVAGPGEMATRLVTTSVLEPSWVGERASVLRNF